MHKPIEALACTIVQGRIIMSAIFVALIYAGARLSYWHLAIGGVSVCLSHAAGNASKLMNLGLCGFHWRVSRDNIKTNFYIPSCRDF